MRNRLRVLRAERGWTQEELARRLGVSRQAIIAIENEKYDPSLSLAFRISRVFAEPIERLFDDDATTTSTTTSTTTNGRSP